MHVSILNDKYFKKYNKYFNYTYKQYQILSTKSLFNYFYGNEKCYPKSTNEYFEKVINPLTNLEKHKSIGNPSYNFQAVIINNKYKSNALIISGSAGVIYRFRLLKYTNKYDLFLQGNLSSNKSNKMSAYRDIDQINHIYSSHEQANYIQSLRDLQSGTLVIDKYKLVSCHYGYITGLPLSASYRSLLVLPYIISSLGIAFKTLEAGGTLILFWTIINIEVPSVNKILTLLGFAFDSVRVITDDINQNFFQGVPEYYLECTGYKANLSTDLINQLLDVGIRGIDYSYRICDILDYFENYSRDNPNQTLFYKHYAEPFASASRGSSASRITKKQTGKSRTKSLRLSQFLQSVSGEPKLKSSLSHHKTRRTHKTENSTSKSTSPPEIKYIEDFDLPQQEWNAIQQDAETSYKVMILANRLEGIFIEFFERVNSMIANDLEVDSHGKPRVREHAITQRKVNDIRRFVNMLETNNIAYNKHLLTILKEQEDELLEKFYTLDNTVNTRVIRYRDPQTRDLIKHGFQDIKLGAPFELDFMNTCFDKINLAYRVKENMKIALGIGAGERVPKIVQEGYEDMTRSLPQYITARYGATLPAIKISNAFTKLWEIMSVFESLIPSAKSKGVGVGTDKFRVFHICEAPGQMIISLKYFLEKKRRTIADYDWVANSLNPYNKENQTIYGKGTIFADDYHLIRENPKKWIWGADGTGDITRIKNIRWYRDHITKPGIDMIVGDGGLSTQSGIGLDPLVLQKLDLAQAVMVLACSRKGSACVIKHFTPYIKKHTSTYAAAGFFIGFLYLYYLAFAEVNLFKPYTSNPDSGEFYVVCQGFLGVDDNELERLYKILERMELNQSIIPEDKIPDTFIYQINGFLERITNLNVMSIEKQNLLLTCYKDGQNPKLKKYLKCDNFLDKDKLVNIQRPRFEEWIKRYGFI